ncbi:MAG: hypothetical protein N2039_10445 [Gemmataceae bacterium]|nr:hypothetical protein [Gemmataceae bacterium]
MVSFRYRHLMPWVAFFSLWIGATRSAEAQPRAELTAEQLEAARTAVARKLPGNEKTHYAIALIEIQEDPFAKVLGMLGRMTRGMLGLATLPLTPLASSEAIISMAVSGEHVAGIDVRLTVVAGKSQAVSAVLEHVTADVDNHRWLLVGSKSNLAAARRTLDAFEKKLKSFEKRSAVPIQVVREDQLIQKR